MILMYSPDGTNVCGLSRGDHMSVHRVESCKLVFLGGGALPIHLFRHTLLLWDVTFSHNAQRHRQTDRQTDRLTTLS